MQRIDMATEAQLLASPLIGLLVGRFFVTVRHRNAWHSKTSSRFRGETSLNLSIEPALVVAEEWRKQGSTFLVREVPGIALLTLEGMAATVDFHHDNGFASWDVGRGRLHLAQGTQLRDTLRSLGHRGDWKVLPNPHSVIQGVESYATVTPVGERAKFSRHTSEYQGSRYALAWNSTEDPRVTARGAHRVRRAFLAVNGPSSIRHGLEEFNAAKDRHREEILAPIRQRIEARRMAAEARGEFDGRGR